VSLLNFLFKDRQGKGAELSDEPGQESGRSSRFASPSPAVMPSEGAPTADPLHAPVGDAALSLDQIREALEQIAEILKDDDERAAQEDIAGNFTTIELTLGQIVDMVPGIFQNASVPQDHTDETVSIYIENLYEQLSTGNVTTTVGRIVSEISENFLVPDYESYRKDDISIPLDLIVASVQQDELEKRTATEELDIGLEDMPNLFELPGCPSDHAATAQFDPFPVDGAPESAVADLAAAVEAPVSPEVTDIPDLPDAPQIPEMPDAQIASVQSESDDVFDRVDDYLQHPAETDDSERISGPSPAPHEDLGLAAEAFGQDEASAEGFDFVIDDSVNVFKLAGSAEVELPPLEPMEMTAPRVAPGVPEPDADEPLDDIDVPAESIEEIPVTEFADIPGLEDDVEEGVDADEDQAWLPAQAMAPGESGAVLLQGVDINLATADEIAERVEGVSARLATRIVRFREQRGPFKDVADLSFVPGVGPTTFERVSGVSWSEARDEERRTLRYLIGGGDDLPDLRAVANRFRDLPGIDGCVIIHEDGHVMASEWEDGRAHVLGAVAPQIFKKILPYADEIDMGELNPVTLYLGENALTIIQSGDLFVAVVHSTHTMTKRQIRLVQLAGAELEQRVDKCKAPV